MKERRLGRQCARPVSGVCAAATDALLRSVAAKTCETEFARIERGLSLGITPGLIDAHHEATAH